MSYSSVATNSVMHPTDGGICCRKKRESVTIGTCVFIFYYSALNQSLNH